MTQPLAHAIRILVVDDDDDSVSLVRHFLSKQGFDVVSAANGREAFLKLSVTPADLIVLDLEMPVMNGATFRRKQLAEEAVAAIPVVIRSSHPYAKDIARELAITEVCQKTDPLEELLSAIEKLLHPTLSNMR